MTQLLADSTDQVPNLFWVWPFVALLGCIAILPLLRRTHHWWEQNHNKLLVAGVLAVITLCYYQFRDFGVPHHGPAPEAHGAEGAADHDAHPVPEHPAPEPAARAPSGAADDHGHEVHRTPPGFDTVKAVLNHAILQEYVPFLVLLFSLYVIAGGIVVRGDIQATPRVNTTILALGAGLASIIGTTGASMVLIRLLLKTNSERIYKIHTVVFFIFLVSNVGGSLLPIGDPPLFLGFLRGVPFFWTLRLWKEWLFVVVALLAIFYLWDTIRYRQEPAKALREDRTHIEPVHVAGMLNLVWIVGVVFAVATLDPSKEFLGMGFKPLPYVREGVQLAMVALSLWLTPTVLRRENQFNYVAIAEVACLFIGIFITMQVPLEILNARGAELGLTKPWQFFWATGVLSSFLDNAPTYVVFFQTATTLPIGEHAVMLMDGTHIDDALLAAISCGAVFMGANSYIGNGPNFMVKSIAEQSGVNMPGFFQYMFYSGVILCPIFVLLTLVFFVF